MFFNSLPNDKIIVWSRLETFADILNIKLMINSLPHNPHL